MDAAAYGGAALFAALSVRYQDIPLQREWARTAVWPYAAGAAVALVLAAASRSRPERRTAARAALAGLVFSGAVAAPLAAQLVGRTTPGPLAHAQSETLITEAAADALLRGEDPYAARFDEGALATWPEGVRTHFPYFPGMLAFGLPRAVEDGRAVWADARLWWLAAALAAILPALVLAEATGQASIRALQALVILPPGASHLSGGGNDVAVLAVMLLALALVHRGRPVAGGLLAGMACAVKQTAWPLAPFLVLAARNGAGRPARGRAAAALLGVLGSVSLPFVLWHPAEFVDDVFRFPLGLGDRPTIAAGPTLGRWIVETVPRLRAPISVLLVAAVLALAAFLLARRPPRTASEAARGAGLVLAAGIVLAPAGRLGYLLYPANLFVWGLLVLPRAPSPSGRPAGSGERLAPHPAP